MVTTGDLKTLTDAVADVKAGLAAKPSHAKLMALIEGIDDTQRRVRPAMLQASKDGKDCEAWAAAHAELLDLRAQALHRQWHPGT